MRYNPRFNDKKILIAVIILMILQIFSTYNVISQENKADLILDIESQTIEMLDEIIEGEQIKIPVIITNDGDKNITDTEIIDLGLKINGELIVSNSSDDGLDVGNSITMNLSWIPAYEHVGQNQILTIIVDYNENIDEENENNNLLDKYVNITEKDTDLKIENITLEKQNPGLDEKINVYVEVKNYGRSTDESFNVTFETIDDSNENIKTIYDVINRNETIQVLFNWTAQRFGNHDFISTIVYKNNTVDNYEKTFFIDAYDLVWWNGNYHYRQIVVTKGSGNVSYQVNFTEFIEEIEISGNVFEEETIKIIRYNNNGEIDNIINDLNFTKNENYDNITNAKGVLKWNVSGNDQLGFYCIYFDIIDNNGIRSITTFLDITISGDVVINKTGFIEGWDYDVKNPSNNTQFIVDQIVDIVVETEAIAENMSAVFYHDDVFVKKLFLNKKNDDITWNQTINFLNKTGNWHVVFSSYDKIGYMPDNKTIHFNVGLLDIISDKIIISTNYPTSPTIYQNDKLNITGVFKTLSGSIDDAGFKIQIYDDSRGEYVYNDTQIKDLNADVENNVVFSWDANETGNYNISITADYNDEIDESEEDNNILEKTIKVNGLPDLAITRIIVPDEEIRESERAVINVTVENLKDVKAENYQVLLYIENAEEVMTYENMIYERNISLNGSEIKKFDLIWEDTTTGEWIIAVLINVSDTKRDLDFDNNRLISNKNLIIRSIGKNPPDITNLRINPNPLEQGESITITARISDENGLEYVKIIITDPDNNSKTWDMIRNTGSNYIFVYDETMKIGRYNVLIKTKDLSIYENMVEQEKTFTVRIDDTEPFLYYVGTNPNVQLTFETLDIYCIASDNIEIEDVSVEITTPDDETINAEMTYSADGRYKYTRSYQDIGRYEYQITISDTAANNVYSEKKDFWITEDLEDKDNDKIPDQWEKLYNLDPENPSDANSDMDNDGFTNLEEYRYGLHPAKNLFSQNAAKRIDENSLYLSGSVLIFIFLLLTVLFLRRRKMI